LAGVSSLQAEASLIVAAFDLNVVQLLRDAIRTADLSQAGQGNAGSPAAVFEPRLHIHPTPVYEPRVHYHPTPTYEARPVIHPQPRVEQRELACSCECKPAPMNLENPIQPPWKILPWENAVQPRQTVKVHLIHTDLVHKGTVLDLFV
jgi:hypothetical protein